MALTNLKEGIVFGRPVVPAWMSKSIIIAVLTTLIGGAGAWIGGVNRIVADAGVINRVQDVQIREQVRRTDSIVSELREMNAILSDIRDRLPRRTGAMPITRYVYVPRPTQRPEEKTDEEVLNGM